MTDQNAANTYLRTKVLSASPEELRLMLLDGALRFANQARIGLESKNFEQSYNGFTQCRAIILELINTINPDHAPEIADRVKSVYSFIYSQLVEASMDRDVPKLDKVIELISYERETWALLMEQIASERKAGAPTPPPPPAQAASQRPVPNPGQFAQPAPNGAPARPSLSIQA